MGGIIGVYSRAAAKGAKRSVDDMLSVQRHRGDVAARQFFLRTGDRNWNRLVGDQMEKPSQIILLQQGGESGSSVRDDLGLVYDGRIFELKLAAEECDAMGLDCADVGRCICQLYDKWGVDGFKYLEGYFAFSLFDSANNRLLLVRDPFGIKPLYYASNGHDFVFASGARSLAVSGVVAARWDFQVTSAFLNYGLSVPPSGRTFFENIGQVPPAHFATFALDTGEITVKPYYTPSIAKPARSFAEVVETARGLVLDSCRNRMKFFQSPVVCLSSGTDSSNVAAALTVLKHRPLGFTLDAAPDEKGDEMPLVRRLVQNLGMQLNTCTLPKQVALSEMARYILVNEEPTTYWGAYNQYYLYKQIREAGYAMTFSGHGGDELFCGYFRYYPSVMREMLGKGKFLTLASWLFRQRNHLRNNWSTISTEYKLYSRPEGWKAYYSNDNQLLPYRTPPDISRDWLREFMGASSWREQSCKSVFHYELPYLLRDADRNSAFNAIEDTVPLLNTKVLEYCLGQRVDYLCHKGKLKAAARDLFPEIDVEVRYQQNKRGMYTDISQYLPGLQEAFITFAKRSRIINQMIYVNKLPERLYGGIWWRLGVLALLDIFYENTAGNSQLLDHANDAELTSWIDMIQAGSN